MLAYQHHVLQKHNSFAVAVATVDMHRLSSTRKLPSLHDALRLTNIVLLHRMRASQLHPSCHVKGPAQCTAPPAHAHCQTNAHVHVNPCNCFASDADNSLKCGGRFPWMVAAFDTFYCFLQQPLWMAYYVKAEHEYGEPTHAVDLHGAINHRDGDLTAQMAAGACLIQICMAENLDPEQDSVPDNQYLQEARQNGSIAALVHRLELAVKVGLSFLEVCSSGNARRFLGCHCCACLLQLLVTLRGGGRKEGKGEGDVLCRYAHWKASLYEFPCRPFRLSVYYPNLFIGGGTFVL